MQTVLLFGRLWRYIALNLKNTTVLTTKNEMDYCTEYIKAANDSFSCHAYFFELVKFCAVNQELKHSISGVNTKNIMQCSAICDTIYSVCNNAESGEES